MRQLTENVRLQRAFKAVEDNYAKAAERNEKPEHILYVFQVGQHVRIMLHIDRPSSPDISYDEFLTKVDL